MRNGTLFLPFVAVFSAILALATGRAYKEIPAISIICWIFAAIAFIAWVVIDGKNFSQMFKRKGARHGMSQGLSILLAILLAVGVGMVTKRERFNKSLDLTKEGINTLTAESEKLVTQLKQGKQEIKILAFFQDELKKTQFRKLLSMYEMKGASFQVEYIDPQTDPTRAMAENVTVPDTVIFKRGKQEARLTTFTEEKFSNALLRVLKDKDKIVYFTTGHGEPGLENQEATGYSLAKAELESERFVVKTVNLLEAGKVPDDADLLIIAGPRYDLQAAEKTAIEEHLQNAKPLALLVDALVDLPNVKALAEETGVKFNDDLLLLRPDDPRAAAIGQNNAIITELDKFSPITADFVKKGSVALVTPFTRSLEFVNDNKWKLKTTGLAKTSDIVVRVTGVKTAADVKDGVTPDRVQTGHFDVFATATGQVGGDKLASTDPKAGSDVKGDAAAKGSKELRVFLSGTSQLANNAGAQRGENLDLFVNAVNFLLQDEDFLSIRARDVDPSRLELTTASSQFLLLFLAYIYPTLFLGAGAYYWMQRRRA